MRRKSPFSSLSGTMLWKSHPSPSHGLSCVIATPAYSGWWTMRDAVVRSASIMQSSHMT